jgi:hypothetical protein
MKTTKILAFAAVAALSLGVGSAMAQNDGPSMPDVTTYAVPASSHQAPAAHQVQSGGSDLNMQSGAGRSVAPAYDYGDLANPG